MLTWSSAIPESGNRVSGFPGDHAGKRECAYRENLYPGTINIERLEEADAGFAQRALEMNLEERKILKKTIDVIVAMRKKG